MKTSDDTYSIGKGFGRIEVRKEGWTDGVVVTEHGLVEVYAQGDAKEIHHTSLRFACAGQHHTRNFHGKRYSPRGLVTQAKRFAADCVNESSADTAGVAPRHATDGIPPLSAALCYPLAESTQNTLP